MRDKALRKALVDAGMLINEKKTYYTTFGYSTVDSLYCAKQDFDFVQRQVHQIQDRIDALALALGYEYHAATTTTPYYTKKKK